MEDSRDPVANLPPIRDVIEQYGLRPCRKLGQNFLLDLNLTRKIARSAGDLSQHPVIEIGPGPGGLTRALLLEGAKKVIAVEYDERAIEALQPLKEAAGGRLVVIHADALETNLKDLTNEESFHIAANLPYNIGTRLIIKWLENYRDIKSLTLMFQKEVAERIVAMPGTSQRGSLSVIVQWYMEGRILFHVPPQAFVPAPKVTSSILHLTPRQRPFMDVPRIVLEETLGAAFGQRRKMLRSSLRTLVGNAETFLIAAGIDPTRRAETLNLEEFGRLSQSLKSIIIKS